MLWLEPLARTILFWAFVMVETLLFVRLITIPIMGLFKLKKGLNYEDASKIIGNHFPQVGDKLLNTLQLKQSGVSSELLLASIEQKSIELKPIPFKLAISFRKNIKYLKYASIPCLIFLGSFITGKTGWFSDSYERVVHYRTAYEPPAPFQFFVTNNNLNAIENKDFKLQVSTAGEVVPETAQIHFDGETFFLQQVASGRFEFSFSQPKDDIEFKLSANDVNSKPYTLSVIKTPTLLNFEMILDYPAYVNKNDEILKSTGTAIIPEGTNVTWKLNTKSTDNVKIYGKDTLYLQSNKPDKFEFTKQVFNNFDYTISTSNDALRDFETLAFSLDVIKDEYPELNLKAEKDSINNETLYFFGQVSDDYGLSKLQVVYYPSEDESQKLINQIPISNSNFDEFMVEFPSQLELKEGVNYDLYFQVFDNDAIHSPKSVKSQLFSFRKLTREEKERNNLEEQKETIKDIGNTFEKLKDQEKSLEELSKIQKEKNELNFNDKKKFENFLKRQKNQEELMRNFNEKLRENMENFQKENNEKDQLKEDIMERLQQNEEQLREDEKLLEELEKLQEKIQKEDFTEKLEELAKKNKNKQKSLQQLLELTKRYYVAKKAEKLQQELEKLALDQDRLSEENKENNTKEEQNELNSNFENFQNELNELQKDNKKLQSPLDIPRDQLTEEDIKKEQKEASEELKQMEENDEKGDNQKSQKNQQSAKQKQKNAAQKMKQLSNAMKQSMMSSGQDQLTEDAEMLRQILDNLVLFSFDQEELMSTFKVIDVDNNEYSKYLRDQSGLREHFEHIDDSLFALSLRQPKISEEINKQITEVFFNLDKSLDQLSENQIYQGTSTQQYTVTAANTLASFLSDVLDNLEAQMGSGQGKGQQEMQLPDIIMGQEEIMGEMEKGLKDSEKGIQEKNGDGEENENKMGEQGENNGDEIDGELYEIYQKQQKLRQALQDKLSKEGGTNEVENAIEKMKEIELDLINKGFTNQTLQKMLDLQYQLLKLENATFLQGIEEKRKSETNYSQYKNDLKNIAPLFKDYFGTTEVLNRNALPFQQIYRKKVQEYFKKENDQL